jgi:hypothetical protein
LLIREAALPLENVPVNTVALLGNAVTAIARLGSEVSTSRITDMTAEKYETAQGRQAALVRGKHRLRGENLAIVSEEVCSILPYGGTILSRFISGYSKAIGQCGCL